MLTNDDDTRCEVPPAFAGMSRADWARRVGFMAAVFPAGTYELFRLASSPATRSEAAA